MPKYTSRSILADIEMDEQFVDVYEKFRNTEMSPEEMNLKIQADRVIYVINRCMAKLSIMAHLPFLLANDAEIIRRYLKQKEAAAILNILMAWGVEFEKKVSDVSIPGLQSSSQPLDSSNSYMKSPRSMSTSKPFIDGIADPKVIHMVDTLFYNKCIRAIIQQAENPKVDRNLMNLIKTLHDLKAIAKTKLYVSGLEEDATKKHIRRAYKSNDLLTFVIEDLKDQLVKQRKELGDQLDQKVGIFEMYDKKMETIKENFQIENRKTLHKSEEVMMHKSIESEAIRTKLEEEARRITNQYENLLADHLEQEKASRLKRFKTETQLQNWLASYDQDIGERQTQYEILKREYDEKKAEMDEFEELIDEQEDEYLTLMEEKQLEEKRIYYEMAYQFLMNRSARKIQRYWRAYRQRRAKRRGKKGKGKGGKKTPTKGRATNK